mgnify:FL=1
MKYILIYFGMNIFMDILSQKNNPFTTKGYFFSLFFLIISLFFVYFNILTFFPLYWKDILNF